MMPEIAQPEGILTLPSREIMSCTSFKQLTRAGIAHLIKLNSTEALFHMCKHPKTGLILRRTSRTEDERTRCARRHSLRSASTGSRREAFVDGMRPAMKVRNTLMPMRMSAEYHGNDMTFSTL